MASEDFFFPMEQYKRPLLHAVTVQLAGGKSSVYSFRATHRYWVYMDAIEKFEDQDLERIYVACLESEDDPQCQLFSQQPESQAVPSADIAPSGTRTAAASNSSAAGAKMPARVYRNAKITPRASNNGIRAVRQTAQSPDQSHCAVDLMQRAWLMSQHD